jgi:hypothetical protein
LRKVTAQVAGPHTAIPAKDLHKADGSSITAALTIAAGCAEVAPALRAQFMGTLARFTTSLQRRTSFLICAPNTSGVLAIMS